MPSRNHNHNSKCVYQFCVPKICILLLYDVFTNFSIKRTTYHRFLWILQIENRRKSKIPTSFSFPSRRLFTTRRTRTDLSTFPQKTHIFLYQQITTGYTTRTTTQLDRNEPRTRRCLKEVARCDVVDPTRPVLALPRGVWNAERSPEWYRVESVDKSFGCKWCE